MASNTGNSIVKVSDSQPSIERAYRFLRNDKIEANDMATAGLTSLLSELELSNTMPALEYTSTLCYRHNVSKELSHTGAYKQSSSKGMAHTVLMVDPETEHTIGLAAQHRWCRKDEKFGTANDRKRRQYETKESYEWQRSSEEMNTRFASVMDNITSVCDRESDMFEFIDYKTNASWNYRGQQNYRGQNNIKLSFSQLINETINETAIIVLLVVGKADALIFFPTN
jgi:hypothetical protein